MTNLDMMGHIGYLYLALGMWLLSYKDKLGWIFRFLGELLWLIVGIKMHMTSIWMWGILFMIIDLRGYRKWCKENAN